MLTGTKPTLPRQAPTISVPTSLLRARRRRCLKMSPSLLTTMSRAVCSLALLPLLASTVAAADLNAMTYEGCFSSSQPLSDQGPYTYQTSGYCQPICVNQGKAVLGLSNGSDCWCGDQLPAANTKVDDSKCNTGCNGYDSEMCGGGTEFFSVYLTGTTDNVSNYVGAGSEPVSSSAVSSAAAGATPAPSSSASNTQPSVITSVAPGTTVVVTMPAAQSTGASTSTSPVSHKSDGGPNVAGIAAGVVVGVVALAAICIGAFFLLRRRRRQVAEGDYKRTTQVNDFMRGSGDERKPPNTAYSNMSDQRLDPEAAAGRRNSVGSIADDQDYSRRILRVANPDSS